MKKRKDKISNRFYYVLIAVFAIVLLAVGVYAYGTSNPPAFGHSVNEVAAPSGCSPGQYLMFNPNDEYSTSDPYYNNWNCRSLYSWTDAGSYVKPASNDAIGATQYCDENGENCVDVASNNYVKSVYHVNASTTSDTRVSVTCPNGKLLSGGCSSKLVSDSTAISNSYPKSDNTWSCEYHDYATPLFPITAYAICASF
jgi:hypothetical protein